MSESHERHQYIIWSKRRPTSRGIGVTYSYCWAINRYRCTTWW